MTPGNTDIFTIFKKDGSSLEEAKFVGLADLGTGDSWKTFPETYQTDNDNYLDLCLKLQSGDDITDIETV